MRVDYRTSSLRANPRSPWLSVSCECATLFEAKLCLPPSMPKLSRLRRAAPVLCRVPGEAAVLFIGLLLARPLLVTALRYAAAVVFALGTPLIGVLCS